MTDEKSISLNCLFITIKSLNQLSDDVNVPYNLPKILILSFPFTYLVCEQCRFSESVFSLNPLAPIKYTITSEKVPTIFLSRSNRSRWQLVGVPSINHRKTRYGVLVTYITSTTGRQTIEYMSSVFLYYSCDHRPWSEPNLNPLKVDRGNHIFFHLIRCLFITGTIIILTDIKVVPIRENVYMFLLRLIVVDYLFF